MVSINNNSSSELPCLSRNRKAGLEGRDARRGSSSGVSRFFDLGLDPLELKLGKQSALNLPSLMPSLGNGH